MKNTPYWQDSCQPILGLPEKPSNGGILIIGGGLAGASVGYFLDQEAVVDKLQIVDAGVLNASYMRNAGHILWGTGESYKAIAAIKGREQAKDLFKLSSDFCHLVYETISEEKIECDYRTNRYHVIPIDKNEEEEIIDSMDMMIEDGFIDNFLKTNDAFWLTTPEDFDKIGFKTEFDGKRCGISTHAHPVKFRNGLINCFLQSGQHGYYSYEIKKIEECGESVVITYKNGEKSTHDAVVVCTNAYSSLIDPFFSNKIDPFRGQILTSKPFKRIMPKIAFSMDHGYIYGQFTADNRLLIGGWRNNVVGGEKGDHELKNNAEITEGLKKFVDQYLEISEKIDWEYCWTGIMGSSHNGLPLISPTNSSLIYTCAGFNGYGFSWAHGSAKLIVDIMMGKDIPDVAYMFRA